MGATVAKAAGADHMTSGTIMLDNGIAEPSCSSWASPCLSMDKADKTRSASVYPEKPKKVFTGYCKVIKPDAYLLPHVEDCVHQVRSACFLSRFDLLKGYWQVPLSQ